MSVDLKERWKSALKDWMPRMRRAGVESVYAFIAASTVWPVVLAYKQGDLAAILAVGAALAGVGGNLLANQIQLWKDKATGEAEAAQEIAALAPDDPLRAELDALLETLDALTLARDALPENERAWFARTLREELARLGNLARFEAAITGDSNIVVKGSRNTMLGVGAQQVIAPVQGDVLAAGAVKTQVVLQLSTVDEAFVRGVIGQAQPAADLRRALEEYLQYLVDRHRYLDFRGMGVPDRVPLRLELVDLYVPLKARIALPHGETLARNLKVAGRALPAAELESLGERLSEPVPLLDLLDEHSGLIILGDPGAGKTTFLKYVTLQLALGARPDKRLPVLVPLSAYANALADHDVRLDDFIADYFHDLGADLPLKAMLGQALQAGAAMVMLDGLDEVKDTSRRDMVVQRVVDFYTFHRRAGNKFLLTSRIIGYRGVRPIATGLQECTVADFDYSEIETFVTQWTAALGKAARGETRAATQEAARERQVMLDAVGDNAGIRRLATNPLLLTIMALMKRQGVTLPERRVELYKKYVETLLSSWNRARGLGRPAPRDLDVVETVKVLAPLALWMHSVSPGIGLVNQGDLMRWLEQLYGAWAEDEPEQMARRFLADVRDTGLLLERGSGQYGFIHLTFEEYLAAVALAQHGQQDVAPVVHALLAHVDDPTWRELSLLAVGYIGIVQQRDQAASAVVAGLLADTAHEPGLAVVLAADAVWDAWPGGVTAACRAESVTALLTVMCADQQVKAPMRVLAGNTLARLGDPRSGVVSVDGMEFSYIPPGSFVMGSQDHNDATKHRNEGLTYGYWLARYPTTNAQFQSFIEAGGYSERRYWPEAAGAGLWQAGWVKGGFFGVDDEAVEYGFHGVERDRPAKFGGVWDLCTNHPVIGVGWYEALAFCRWLTDRFSAKLPTGYSFMLPSEAEWEKAARGGEQIPKECVVDVLADGLALPSELTLIANPSPERELPFEGPFDAESVTVGPYEGPSRPVGWFPRGASPYGLLDMSHDVYEWTRSQYKAYPYNPTDGREDLKVPVDALRVVRGYGCGRRGTLKDGWHATYRGLPCDLGFRVAASPFRL